MSRERSRTVTLLAGLLVLVLSALLSTSASAVGASRTRPAPLTELTAAQAKQVMEGLHSLGFNMPGISGAAA